MLHHNVYSFRALETFQLVSQTTLDNCSIWQLPQADTIMPSTSRGTVASWPVTSSGRHVTSSGRPVTSCGLDRHVSDQLRKINSSTNTIRRWVDYRGLVEFRLPELNMQTMYEIRTMRHPPPQVHTLVTVLFMVLGYKETEVRV